jgi:hypothetical protein
MEITIEKEITKDLLQKIFCLYDESFSPTVKVSHPKIKKRILTETYKVITLNDQSKNCIGFSLISLKPDLKTLFIDYLCVDKKFQKFGYGKKILQSINDKQKMFSNYDYTILECENYLIPYYEKNHYTKIPLSYPIENTTPLYLLYRKRTNPESTDEYNQLDISMYYKFIRFGLLFNGEIIIYCNLFYTWLSLFLFLQEESIVKLILNFKTTHT